MRGIIRYILKVFSARPVQGAEFSKGKNMNALTKRIWNPALFIAGLLLLAACDFAPRPEDGQGNLTVILGDSAGGRSVLPDSFIGALKYRLSLSGPGGTVNRDATTGSASFSLLDGAWTVTAKAYAANDTAYATVVGSGSETVTITAGQYQSVIITMAVDSAYENTLTDIYIHNEAELRRIGAAVNGLAINNPAVTFHMVNDITLTQPWTPVGDGPVYDPVSGVMIDYSFKAIFDGHGHTITIDAFSDLSKKYIGFLGYTNGATIKDLNITYKLAGTPANPLDITADTDAYIGGVAGCAYDTRFENLTVDGSIIVKSTNSGCTIFYAGGIAGEINEDTSGAATGTVITGCQVTGTVAVLEGDMVNVGGLAGRDYFGLANAISNSSFTGTVKAVTTRNNNTGGVLAGGLGGDLTRTSISSSYAVGTVEAKGQYAWVGGIAGDAGAITDCYAYTDVRAEFLDASASGYCRVGGIAGSVGYTALSRCYAAGTVTGVGANSAINAGGIAGVTSTGGDIENCIALLDSLNGGTSSILVSAICGDNSYTTETLSNNFTRSDTVITAGAVTPDTERDGAAFALAALQGQASQPVYAAAPPTGAAWTFSASGWKWAADSTAATGYPYPILYWQTAAPDLSALDGGFGIMWP
jgi:hypothetical protein